MGDLISKLSKADQRGVNMALMNITHGNKAAADRVLESMLRAANSRSHSILLAIKELVL